MASIWRQLREPVLAGCLWSVLAMLGLGLRIWLDTAVVIWLPSAVTVAALHATRRGQWPMLCAVMFVLQGITIWAVGSNLTISLVYSAAVIVQGLVTTSLGLAVLGGSERKPSSFIEIVGLFGAAMAGCLVSAAIALPLRAEQSVAEYAWWFFANVLGILTLTPILLHDPRWLGRPAGRWTLALDWKFWAWLAASAALATMALQVTQVALMPLLFAVMVYLTFRHGDLASRGTVLVFALAGTLLSAGETSPMPVFSHVPGEGTLGLQTWLLAMLATALPLAAILSKRDELQQDLVEQNGRLHRTVTTLGLAERVAGIGRWRLDLCTGGQEWSATMLELNGLPASLGPDPGNLRHLMPDNGETLFGEIAAHRASREPFAFDYRVKPPEGTERILRLTALNDFDECGRRIGLFGVAMDVTQQVRREEALDLARGRAMKIAEQARDLANTDGLTGLQNRRSTMGALERMIMDSAQGMGPFTAVIFDIDHFKQVNDRYGHQAGDEVLVRVARLAQLEVRSEDVIGRIGGEEFVWLLPGVEKPMGRVLAERLRSAIETGSGCGTIPGVTISMGLAQWRPGDTPEDVLARADIALYEAKEGGRNRVQLAA